MQEKAYIYGELLSYGYLEVFLKRRSSESLKKFVGTKLRIFHWFDQYEQACSQWNFCDLCWIRLSDQVLSHSQNQIRLYENAKS